MKINLAISLYSLGSGKHKIRRGRGASVKSKERKVKSKFTFPKKTFFVVFGFGFLIFGMVNFKYLYEKVNAQKIEHVVIEKGLDYVAESEVETAMSLFVEQSLISIDLDAVKDALELNPWIKSVSVQREWPDTLVLDIQEEQAIARWGEAKLLNENGEIFSPHTELSQIHLPFLSGPEGMEARVMEQYQEFNQLLYPQGLSIASLSLDNRDAWKMELTNGVLVNVGKNRMMEKMRRFMASIEYLRAEQLDKIFSVDLRYNNGIAITREKYLSEEVVLR